MSVVSCESARIVSTALNGLSSSASHSNGRRLAAGYVHSSHVSFTVTPKRVYKLKIQSFGSKKFFTHKSRAFNLVQVAAQQVATTANSQEVEFFWKGDANEVLLTGSFLNWESKISLRRIGEGLFSVKHKLKPGTHSYKYIVDGEWKHANDMPIVTDGTGGFNNTLTVQASAEPKPEPKAAPEASSIPVPATPKPTPAALAETTTTPAPKSTPAPKAAAAAEAETKPAPKAAGKKAAGKKAAAKPIGNAMEEDIIPLLRTTLEKEDISELELAFEDNQLRGSFLKENVRYQFCAYFPDGILEGSRGFSLTSRGNPFSTVEPFLIDEKKVTTELLVFWVQKRLFAQKLLSLN